MQKQTLLVIAPHPDDEVLGCGGLIKKIKDNNGKVFVLFLTVGNTKDYASKKTSSIKQRMAEIEKVAKFLKYDDYRIIFPGDNFHLKLDSIPQKDLIMEIENGKNISINKIKPTIITTPHISDYNQDHRACAHAVFTALRPAPNRIKFLQRTVLGYESMVAAQWGTTNYYSHNFFVELSENDLKTKITALKIYSSQIVKGNHSRSSRTIRNLSYIRGISSGTKMAEAFYSYRIVV